MTHTKAEIIGSIRFQNSEKFPTCEPGSNLDNQLSVTMNPFLWTETVHELDLNIVKMQIKASRKKPLKLC